MVTRAAASVPKSCTNFSNFERSSDPPATPIVAPSAVRRGIAIVTIGTCESLPRMTSEIARRLVPIASMKYCRSAIVGIGDTPSCRIDLGDRSVRVGQKERDESGIDAVIVVDQRLPAG